MIPYNWDTSFGKFNGLPTVVTFQEINFQGRDKLIFLKYECQWVPWSVRTIPCKIPIGKQYTTQIILVWRCGQFLLVSIRQDKQHCVNQSMKSRTNTGHWFW